VCAPGTGAIIELARLAGPHTGIIDAPPHLLPTPPARLTLNDPADRARPYTACLRYGDPYDVYRYINLHDLAGLLPSLPATLSQVWAHALRDAGLPIPPPGALAPVPAPCSRPHFPHQQGGERHDRPLSRPRRPCSTVACVSGWICTTTTAIPTPPAPDSAAKYTPGDGRICRLPARHPGSCHFQSAAGPAPAPTAGRGSA
jgi:hypothetical protein